MRRRPRGAWRPVKLSDTVLSAAFFAAARRRTLITRATSLECSIRQVSKFAPATTHNRDRNRGRRPAVHGMHAAHGRSGRVNAAGRASAAEGASACTSERYATTACLFLLRALSIPFSPSWSAASHCAPKSTSARTTSTWPETTARCRGVSPVYVRGSTVAPSATSARVHSVWPLRAATCTTPSWYSLTASSEAPSSTSAREASVLPFIAAICSGVQPTRSRTSTVAPAWASTRAHSAWLLTAAKWRGVHPSESPALTAAPASASAATVAGCPFSAATMSAVDPSSLAPFTSTGSVGRRKSASTSSVLPVRAASSRAAWGEAGARRSRPPLRPSPRPARVVVEAAMWTARGVTFQQAGV
mmetsp:Transcript_77972/g.223889  ORF Transcript_77972/g.223889 Transcript_77972/m.223889 type:complete len:359 (-) Transcript_77972:74-1150(-)